MKKFVKFSKLQKLAKKELKNVKGGVSCEIIGGIPLYGIVIPLYGIDTLCSNDI